MSGATGAASGAGVKTIDGNELSREKERGGIRRRPVILTYSSLAPLSGVSGERRRKRRIGAHTHTHICN